MRSKNDMVLGSRVFLVLNSSLGYIARDTYSWRYWAWIAKICDVTEGKLGRHRGCNVTKFMTILGRGCNSCNTFSSAWDANCLPVFLFLQKPFKYEQEWMLGNIESARGGNKQNEQKAFAPKISQYMHHVCYHRKYLLNNPILPQLCVSHTISCTCVRFGLLQELSWNLWLRSKLLDSYG